MLNKMVSDGKQVLLYIDKWWNDAVSTHSKIDVLMNFFLFKKEKKNHTLRVASFHEGRKVWDTSHGSKHYAMKQTQTIRVSG